MTIELVCCEQTLLREIAEPTIRRKHVAMTYAMALASSERNQTDWKKVNLAIVARWSPSALEWVKKEAWRIWENRGYAT